MTPQFEESPKGQQMDCGPLGYAPDLHRGDGHERRERLASPHSGQHECGGGRSHLGTYILSCLQRNHNPHYRLAGQRFRQEALSNIFSFALHGQFDPLRRCAVSSFAYTGADSARSWRRRTATAVSGDLAGNLSRREHGMAMAVFGMGVVMAPIVGPVVGGWITDEWSWRWIFYINLPAGILAVFMTTLFIHDPPI